MCFCLVFCCVWVWCGSGCGFLVSCAPASFSGAPVPHQFINPCCIYTMILPSLSARSLSMLLWYIGPILSQSLKILSCSLYNLCLHVLLEAVYNLCLLPQRFRNLSPQGTLPANLPCCHCWTNQSSAPALDYLILGTLPSCQPLPCWPTRHFNWIVRLSLLTIQAISDDKSFGLLLLFCLLFFLVQV